jgi:hypothetical protein
LQVSVNKRFSSVGLSRALLEVWLGSNAVIPAAKQSFAQGVRQLVEFDQVERGEWKPGGRGTDM